MQRSDAELVEAACRGDVASFRELYNRHHNLAVAIAHTCLSDRHMAEDAAQEAFAIACRRLDSLRDGRRFPEWLSTICRRSASRMARSRTNHRPIEDGFAVKSQETCDAEMTAQVRGAVDRLPPKGREVILLHYFSGLTYEQISEALRISTQSVHGRLQRARRALAKELDTADE